MELFSAFDPQIRTWVVIPLFIFVARVLDVSMQTMRIIFISRGMKIIAPLVGFFEVIIWLFAIGEIMKNLNNPVCFIAYASGFSMGSYFGILMEQKLSIGVIALRVITAKSAEDLIDDLRVQGYGVTSVDANGKSGQVHLIFTILKRKDTNSVIRTIHKHNPKAFISTEDIRFVADGVFPKKMPITLLHSPFLPRHFRKSK